MCEIGDAHMRCHVDDDALQDADELIVQSVISQKRHVVVHCVRVNEKGRCQPPDGTGPFGAALFGARLPVLVSQHW